MFTFYDHELKILGTSQRVMDFFVFRKEASIIFYEKPCGGVIVLKAELSKTFKI